jgi:uracil-DNA glycosylase
MSLEKLLADVRACELCEAVLPFGPRPVLRLASSARVLIVSQAPGRKVHESGIPWNDASGDRLRDWLAGVTAVSDDGDHVNPSCSQDDRPSGVLSSQRRAAWMVENVLSRRPGRIMVLTILTKSSLPDEPVKIAIGPGVVSPLSDLA